jgi:hypothetical protein
VHAEVDVDGQAVVEPVEQVLAVGLDRLQRATGDPFGVGLEPPLGRGDGEPVADEQRGVQLGEPVDRVTFGHG